MRSNRSVEWGNTSFSFFKNSKKSFRACWYRVFVMGWTVSCLRGPNVLRCFALASCVACSRTPLGMAPFSFPGTPTRGVRRIVLCCEHRSTQDGNVKQEARHLYAATTSSTFGYWTFLGLKNAGRLESQACAQIWTLWFFVFQSLHPKWCQDCSHFQHINVLWTIFPFPSCDRFPTPQVGWDTSPQPVILSLGPRSRLEAGDPLPSYWPTSAA